MKDGFLKAAALSPSLRVADCNYNASQIVSQLQDAAARGVRLAVFPEFCLTGYTCGDLFLQRTLQQGALDALQTVLDASRELDVVALVGLPLLVRGKLYNCAAVLCGGRGYLLHPEELKKFEAFAGDGAVLARLDEIKRANKLDFAAYVKKTQGVALNTDAIFDVQVKRLHEYKRQLLNAMHIIYLYQKLQDDPSMELQPRTFLFGAKAAPGYAVAKRIIHLINSLANQINSDPLCRGRLQVVFLENYRVSLAEHLMPASEVSQQISTAGKEASGTGNMKFMMNGALTVGTLDGANVEMHEVLGDENMFLFGLHADEVARLKAQGYAPQRLCERDDALKRVVDQFRTGFSDGVSYDDLAQRLLQRDEYMLLQDFASYCAAEQRMAKTYADRAAWDRMSLLNIARSGIFAADRAVAQYADNIWHVPHK